MHNPLSRNVPIAQKYNPAIVRQYFRENGLPEPVFEHRFHKDRKWRFDVAWPDLKAAIEVDGGISAETAPIVVGRGADTLVVGSAIFSRQDRRAAIEDIRQTIAPSRTSLLSVQRGE